MAFRNLQRTLTLGRTKSAVCSEASCILGRTQAVWFLSVLQSYAWRFVHYFFVRQIVYLAVPVSVSSNHRDPRFWYSLSVYRYIKFICTSVTPLVQRAGHWPSLEDPPTVVFYRRICPSIRRYALVPFVPPVFVPASVRPSVRPTVRPSVRTPLRPSLRPSLPSSVRPFLRPSLRQCLCQYQRLSLRPSLRPFLRQSLFPSVRSSVSPSVRLSLCQCHRLSLRPSFRQSVCPSVSPSIILSVTPCVSSSFPRSVRPSVRTFIPPSVLPSVRPSVRPSLRQSPLPSVSPSVPLLISPSDWYIWPSAIATRPKVRTGYPVQSSVRPAACRNSERERHHWEIW